MHPDPLFFNATIIRSPHPKQEFPSHNRVSPDPFPWRLHTQHAPPNTLSNPPFHMTVTPRRCHYQHRRRRHRRSPNTIDPTPSTRTALSLIIGTECTHRYSSLAFSRVVHYVQLRLRVPGSSKANRSQCDVPFAGSGSRLCVLGLHDALSPHPHLISSTSIGNHLKPHTRPERGPTNRREGGYHRY